MGETEWSETRQEVLALCIGLIDEMQEDGLPYLSDLLCEWVILYGNRYAASPFGAPPIRTVGGLNAVQTHKRLHQWRQRS
jgi:hypothetical protein